MAQFSYENYTAQQEARKNSNAGGAGNYGGVEVHFMNEFLKDDGDVAVVRFPYKSMADITIETTHSVTFPGKKYPSRVRCTGDTCNLCNEGVKLDSRFFCKAIVYVVDEATGGVKLVNAVWDRPSAFADIDIKNLIQEYGDLSEQLFKIKRNGSGTATRYTISIIMNKTVYNPEAYIADFSGLNGVDPARILSKSLTQYTDAVNGTTSATKQPASVEASVAEPAAPVTPVSTPTSAPTTAPEQRRQTRYQF